MEAKFVWRRLLAARGLIARAPKLSERPHVSIAHPDTQSKGRRLAAAGASADRHSSSGFPPLALLPLLLVPLAAVGLPLLLRRRRIPS
jgi:hypothetical protein